jgi:hypothetical protein
MQADLRAWEIRCQVVQFLNDHKRRTNDIKLFLDWIFSKNMENVNEAELKVSKFNDKMQR